MLKKMLTRVWAVMYSGAVEIRGTLPVLWCNTARKEVNNYECIALNLPESVRTGTFPLNVDTGWALFVFAFMVLIVEIKGEIIMSKKSNVPAYSAVGNLISIGFQKRKNVQSPAEIDLKQKIINALEKYADKGESRRQSHG